jgi:CubicO group peptidase (beta-lactamase class C family)
VTKLDAAFGEVAKKQALPGLAVGLVVDGDLVWSKGYGVRDLTSNAPVDADTVFRIGSITKTFTADAALQLRDAGRLSLDEPASRWLPELADVVYPTADSAPITLRALLTHTSGLPRLGNFEYTDPKRAPTEQEITASLRGLPMQRAAGVESEYSNLGVALAGIAVGRAAGMPYRDYVSGYLLRPLGMTSTVWDREAVPEARLATAYSLDEKGAPKRVEHWRLGASEGAGGIYSSVHDMARWVAMHLQAMPPRDDADGWPVKRATLREAMTIHEGVELQVKSTSPLDVRAGGVGFAWHAIQDCDLDDVVWHNGGTDGYSAMLAMAPTRGVAIIALTNLQPAPIERPVLDALRGLARAGAIPARAPVASPPLLEAKDRVLRLYDRWDDAEAQRLLSPLFVSFAGGLPKVRGDLDALHQKLGACAKSDGDLEAANATGGHFRMQCERGSLTFKMKLATAAPVSLMNFGYEESVAPPDALSKAAARIAALPETWNDATFDELLTPTFERGEMKTFFAKVGKDAGACKVDHVTGGDGAQQAKWRLECTKAPLDLELTIDGHNGRVGRLLIVPAKEADMRCPR